MPPKIAPASTRTSRSVLQRAWFLAALLLLSSCVRSLSIQPTLIPGPPQAASAIPAPTFSPVPPAASPFAGVTASPAASQPPAAPPETATTGKPLPKEQPVVQIPLDGPAATQEAELTGMAWYSSTLILLPRDPARFADKLPESTPPADGAVFVLDKAEILSFLDGASPGPLTPRLVPVLAPGLAQPVNGFTGFQAIAVQGERIFLTLAAKPGPAARSYLVTGLIAPGLTSLHLDTAHTASISPDAGLPDAVEKSLVVAGSRLLTFNEANGRGVNPAPQAHLFDLSLREQGTLPFPNLEYRLGDMTPPDDAGQFWATNYFFPLDRALAVDSDPLFELYPKGYTHSVWITVERLVQFQFGEFGIHLSDIPPIQLQLLDDNHPRQWEAIARLDGRGFLLATDRNPTTILGFVALP